VLSAIAASCRGLIYLSIRECEEIIVDNIENMTDPDDDLFVFPNGLAGITSCKDQLPKLFWFKPLGSLVSRSRPDEVYPLEELGVTWRF